MDFAPRSVSILGSTGSVGQNTVELINHHCDKFTVDAVTAGRNVKLLARQARQLKAKLAVIAEPSLYHELKQELSGSGIGVASGADSLIEAAAQPAELVVAAIVGAVGLKPCLTAIRRGAILAFANKEVLVCAGELVMNEVRIHGATLLPIDSEHNAIFQIFDPNQRAHIERIILTASGGPFRTWTPSAIAKASHQDALNHPNWSMGAKISIDSATMMNKGLEIIEAHHLFALDESKIDVVVHPQSIIHSMVEYEDGSVLAQLGSPDMRTPIAHALAWPQRMASTGAKLNLLTMPDLQFFPPDFEKFPALRLAREALRQAQSVPTMLNAANEVAVAAFLEKKINFGGITEMVEQSLSKIPSHRLGGLDDILAVDFATRQITRELVREYAV
ncbi:MAG: 1-deoxy-D-xylulose-5-phosphate reductoisomerase [Alphaproteobacteria bacterium]|nr:1-deoxy-D-xylulose-5-phosphate reductoisomerase [Alphaproteobacteria bacterium]